MKALITVGCMTDHGGIISTGDSSYLVEGKAVHLDGMTHFCPKCKVQARAIASNQGFMMVGGKSIVAVGDQATCGAKYLKISDLAVMGGSGSSYKQLFISSTQESFKDNLISENEKIHGIVYQLVDEITQEPVANMYYKLVDNSGNSIEGETDENGYTQEFTTGSKSEEIKLFTYDLSEPLPPLE